MSDSSPPSAWRAEDTSKAAPLCPTCKTFDMVEAVYVGTDSTRMRRWYCAAPFCHTVFSVGDVASEKTRAHFKRCFVMLRNYLEQHPSRRMRSTDEILAREPADESREVA